MKKYYWPLANLILGGIAIGFAPIFVRLSSVGPFATGFWRVALALPILILLSLTEYRGKKVQINSSLMANYGWIILGGIFFAGDLATWHISINYTTIANATLLVNLSPVVIALWGWLVLREPMQKKLVIGLGLIGIGAYALINPSFQMNKQMLIGIIFGLIAACFYAGYLLVTMHARKNLGTFTTMMISTASTTFVLLLVTALASEDFGIHITTSWDSLLSLAIISHVIGQGLIAYALPYLPIALSSAVLIIQPIVAALASWFLFDEALSCLQLAGIGVALMGIYLIKHTTITKEKK